MRAIAFAWNSDGWRGVADRPLRMAGLVLCAALGLMAAAAHGAVHERGRVSLSIGGSFAHSQNEEVREEGASQVVFDDLIVELEPTEDRDTYSDIDLSLFLSSGYFVLERTEFGVLGSTLLTRYSGTDRDDFSLYDGQLYARYFFDNATSLTPFLKVQGGLSWLKSGDYDEANQVAGLVAGLEYYGMGALAYFMEISSQYTELGGDRTGYEWRNQVYLGVSLYLDLRKEAREAEERAVRPLQNLPPEIRRWVLQADSEWDEALRHVDRKANLPEAVEEPTPVDAPP